MQHRLNHRRGRWIATVATAWAISVVGAMLWLEQYANRPGQFGATPLVAPIAWSHDAPHLVMFIHPHCPCTWASVGELKKILGAPHAPVHVEVVLVLPPGVPTDWEKTPLAAEVSAINGVQVRTDVGGAEASSFGAQTSGHVVLYAADGRLLYSGGITRSRGHEGDNPGSESVLALLNGRDADESARPVFGCPLVADGGAACPVGPENSK